MIITQGARSSGIFAQSLGGGGGNGGLSFAGAISLSEGKTFNVGFGGDGGTGNSSGAVSVFSRGTTITTGVESHGIFAQSLAGGGGNGGFALTGGLVVGTGSDASLNVNVSIGGAGGGSMNIGGAVRVDSDGLILTTATGSHGIFAQSIGGGGGNGGAAVSLAVANTSTGSARNFQAAVGVGGSGGTGSAGGAVTVIQDGGIITTASHSIGIFAQSVGGGGGTAGGANVMSLQLASQCTLVKVCTNTTTSKNYQAQFTMGGEGGTGNNGGIVDVTNSGFIRTNGDLSHGILAQSIGAGGGEGGDAKIGAAALIPDELCLAGDSLCIPGEPIQVGTSLLLSVVGNTGNNDGKLGMINKLLNLSIGGDAGASGNGGAVTVHNSGQISTLGTFANGIVAQSVGGGGGSGGVSGAGTGFSFGGDGAASGDGGVVLVVNDADIFTSGQVSSGILAQSVGGGGGSFAHVGTFLARDQWPDDYQAPGAAGGGGCAGAVCVGGDGGANGDGGFAGVINSGRIETLRGASHGILAQSIGGGGGNFNFGVFNPRGPDDENVAAGAGTTGYVYSQGGDGGAAGDGGVVLVISTGDILTLGDFSHGIFAQSVGGGGGNGGVQSTGASTDGTIDGFAASLIGALSGLDSVGLIANGGNGGAGGAGGVVAVDTSGTIATFGAGSYGVLAQSIGGGGGDSGSTFGLISIGGGSRGDNDGPVSGDGGDVTVHNHLAGQIYVSGEAARGIFAQSVGGGGGSGGSSTGGFLVGGQGGGFGDGGVVTVINDGLIYAGADADNARGIFAQSIGGGGGATTTTAYDVVSRAAPTGLGHLGGDNGAAGDGGAVHVTNAATGVIYMAGDNAIAILAQSIGGGGGDAGGAVAELNLAMGGNATIGNGGKVVVDNVGAIILTGDRGIGILAQSIGGGGGSILIDADALADAKLGGLGSTVGQGGDVTITNIGSIILTGDHSVAMIGQSIGGGGGTIRFAQDGAVPLGFEDQSTGDGGKVTIVQQGDIRTIGANTYGLLLQSVGGGGGWVDGGFAGAAGGAGAGQALSFDYIGDILSTGQDSTAAFAQSVGRTGGGDITGSLDGAVRGGSGSAWPRSISAPLGSTVLTLPVTIWPLSFTDTKVVNGSESSCLMPSEMRSRSTSTASTRASTSWPFL